MKLIVGLGNPGQEYSATRHNIGFMAVDALAERWGVTVWRNKFEALIAEYRGSEPMLLVKPQTYMNLSGQAVSAVLRWYKLLPQDVIVIYDDLDLSVGRLRLAPREGLAVTVGLSRCSSTSAKMILTGCALVLGDRQLRWTQPIMCWGASRLKKYRLFMTVISQAVEAVEAIIEQGMTKAGNKFNS